MDELLGHAWWMLALRGAAGVLEPHAETTTTTRPIERCMRLRYSCLLPMSSSPLTLHHAALRSST